jgi:hypothetical protein
MNNNSIKPLPPTQTPSSPNALSVLHGKLEMQNITIENKKCLVGTLIEFFLNDPINEDKWDYMDEGIKLFLSNNTTIEGLRVLISTPDGTVAYDSSKTTTNTFNNYKSSIIGENHNTRPEMLVALLGTSGVGNSQRLSRTTSEKTLYHAERIGTSTSNPVGFSRVSIKLI